MAFKKSEQQTPEKSEKKIWKFWIWACGAPLLLLYKEKKVRGGYWYKETTKMGSSMDPKLSKKTRT